MTPALGTPEIAEISEPSTAGRALRVGDVVLFRRPDRELIAHRIVGIGTEGLRTRGDNNPAPDQGWLDPADVLGRVARVFRGGGWHRVRGGRRGAMLARVGHWKWVALRRGLGPVYRRLEGCLGRLLPQRWISPTIVVFHTPRGPGMRLKLAGRWVGSLPPGGRRWRIRAPYRLVLDASQLPSLD